MPINPKAPPREAPPVERVQEAVRANQNVLAGLVAIVAAVVVMTPAAPIAVPLAFVAGSIVRRV